MTYVVKESGHRQWRSQDYLCDPEQKGCGHRWDEVVAFAEKDLPRLCPACGWAGIPVIGAPALAQVSHPDGTTHRFADLKEQRKIRREERKAVWKQDKREMAKIKQEKAKLKMR